LELGTFPKSVLELVPRSLHQCFAMRARPATLSNAAAAITLLLVSLTACQQPKPVHPAPPPPKVAYHETYDPEIKEIMDLARQDRWEAAQAKAAALFQKDPKNPMVERVHSWVLQAG